GRGRFAYDASGEYVVVNGFAWFRRGASDMVVAEEEDTEEIPFWGGPMPWAYLPILNSAVFQVLLAHFCSSLGGHVHLHRRDMEVIPLPDLSSEDSSPETLESLAEIGREIARGKPMSPAALSQIAAAAYRIPLAEWGLDHVST